MPDNIQQFDNGCRTARRGATIISRTYGRSEIAPRGSRPDGLAAPELPGRQRVRGPLDNEPPPGYLSILP